MRHPDVAADNGVVANGDTAQDAGIAVDGDVVLDVMASLFSPN